MKDYPSIDGPRMAPRLPCIAFDKLDGSNLRFEWSKKQGWHKFATKKEQFDETSKQFGRAIPLFMETLAEALVKVIKDTKEFRGTDRFTVFCEFWGPQSFAGWHADEDDFRLTLIDVAIHKWGMVVPRQFLKHFGHLPIPNVVYEGNFNRQLIEDVWEDKLLGITHEGIVAKGVNPKNKGREVHGLWMNKSKTGKWMRELKRRAEESAYFKGMLADEKDDVRELETSTLPEMR